VAGVNLALLVPSASENAFSLITTVMEEGKKLLETYNFILFFIFENNLILLSVLTSKKGLLSIVIVSALCAALSTFSPNYNSLLAVRIMVRVEIGGVPVYGSWFLEFLPSQNKGMWTIICTCFWTIRTILEALLALMIMPRLGWRWPLALSSIPSFVELLLFVFTIESPRYLCAMGQTSYACDILKKIAVVNKTQLPPGKLVSSQLTEELHSPGKNKISSVKSGFSSLPVLLSPALHRNTLLIWVVYIGNNSSYYTIILLTSLFSCEQRQHSLIAFHTKDDQSLYTNVLIDSLADYVAAQRLRKMPIYYYIRKGNIEVEGLFLSFSFCASILTPPPLLAIGQLHLLSPLLLFSFIVVSSTATHLQFGRPPSSHLGSPLLFGCSKFCTLVESTVASYIRIPRPGPGSDSDQNQGPDPGPDENQGPVHDRGHFEGGGNSAGSSSSSAGDDSHDNNESGGSHGDIGNVVLDQSLARGHGRGRGRGRGRGGSRGRGRDG
ncbi:hypothetical protein H5410_060104, partial [Solanum commersonii]